MPTHDQGPFRVNDLALLIAPYLGPDNVGRTVTLIQALGAPNTVTMDKLRLRNRLQERIWLVQSGTAMVVCPETRARFHLPLRIFVFPIPERFLMRLGETDGPKGIAFVRTIGTQQKH